MPARSFTNLQFSFTAATRVPQHFTNGPHSPTQAALPAKAALVAVSRQSTGDFANIGFRQDRCPAKIAAAFVRHARGQVARSWLAKLHLTIGGYAEPLFGSLVRLLFWHGSAYETCPKFFAKTTGGGELNVEF